MYLLIIYLPLISAITVGLFGRFFGVKGSQFITIINMGICFIISVLIFNEVLFKGTICYISLFNWFNIGLLEINWGFVFDQLASTMLVVVTSISFLVHLYSVEYMNGDPFNARFMSYLSLFTWFMIMLVTADNFLQLFLGWEGVGLVSYLLINFWFSILEANKSALKAMVVNRVGDLGIALGMGLIYLYFKTLNFNVFLPLVPFYINEYFTVFNWQFNCIDIISILIFIGAVGKSAQLGLHVWLPDAMAGPTPVSALIHAATMVTAGVFVLIKVSPLLEYSTFSLTIISIVGVSTSFFAASVGLFQNDLKKIIAYSTCSQLGYMVFICGLSNYSLSLFHLTNHAFFKALLFLSAGSIIHAMSDEQDIRKMGGLINLLPYSYVMLLIGSLALMGTPFLTGFYSKDFILEASYSSYFFKSGFVYWIGTLSALFTAFYSVRLIFFVFITKINAYKQITYNIAESGIYICIPLAVLSLCSIFFGYIFKDLFIGLGTDTWLNSIHFYGNNPVFLESEFLPVFIKQIPLLFSITGSCLVFFFNDTKISFLILKQIKKNFYIKQITVNLLSFLSYKWYIDVIYNKYLVRGFFNMSYFLFKNIDRGLLELWGPLGLTRLINFCRISLSNINTSYIYHYLYIFLVSIGFLLSFIFKINLYLDIELWFFFLIISHKIFTNKIKWF